MALTSQTAIRSTDISTEIQYDRLGNDANGLYDDLISRIHQSLGFPIEITPNATAGFVNISSGEYALPDGSRLAVLVPGSTGSSTVSIGSGAINFTLGAISVGTNPTFSASVPAGNNWIRALVQYNPDKNAFNVTYGTQNASLTGLGTGPVLPGYYPLYVIDLRSSGNSLGQVLKANISKIINSFSYAASVPLEEIITVAAAGTVFNLVSVVVPANRERSLVFVNGVRQILGGTADFLFSLDTQLTFSSTLPIGAVISVRV